MAFYAHTKNDLHAKALLLRSEWESSFTPFGSYPLRNRVPMRTNRATLPGDVHDHVRRNRRGCTLTLSSDQSRGRRRDPIGRSHYCPDSVGENSAPGTSSSGPVQRAVCRPFGLQPTSPRAGRSLLRLSPSLRSGRASRNIDLLFYHRRLHCHVLVSVRARGAREEAVRQLEKDLRQWASVDMIAGDRLPIGLLISLGSALKTEFDLGEIAEVQFETSYQDALPNLKDLLADLQVASTEHV